MCPATGCACDHKPVQHKTSLHVKGHLEPRRLEQCRSTRKNARASRASRTSWLLHEGGKEWHVPCGFYRAQSSRLSLLALKTHLVFFSPWYALSYCCSSLFCGGTAEVIGDPTSRETRNSAKHTCLAPLLRYRRPLSLMSLPAAALDVDAAHARVQSVLHGAIRHDVP